MSSHKDTSAPSKTTFRLGDTMLLVLQLAWEAEAEQQAYFYVTCGCSFPKVWVRLSSSGPGREQDDFKLYEGIMGPHLSNVPDPRF